jgi:membrane-bound acyltransferase YfiQ involved in biofilm formation
MFYHWSKNQENKKNWIVGGINQFMWIFLIISLAFVTVDVVLFIDWCVSFVMPDDIYQYLAWIIFVPFVVFFAIKLKKKNKPKIKEEKEKKIKFEVELKDKKKAKLQ